jgi:hypothetical protein
VNESGRGVNTAAMSSATAIAMFSARSASSSGRGSGTISIATTAMTSPPIASSPHPRFAIT